LQAEEHLSQAPARKSIEDMSPEQRARVDQVDLRCLSMCIGMLERVNSVCPHPISLTLRFDSSATSHRPLKKTSPLMGFCKD